METEVTTQDLMRRFNVSITTVRRWMKKGMPSILRTAPGGLKMERRFIPSEVDKWLEGQRRTS